MARSTKVGLGFPLSVVRFTKLASGCELLVLAAPGCLPLAPLQFLPLRSKFDYHGRGLKFPKLMHVTGTAVFTTPLPMMLSLPIKLFVIRILSHYGTPSLS